MPRRMVRNPPMDLPEIKTFESFLKGSEGRAVSTTMAFVGILATLLKDKVVKEYIVPIIPDEARTFGMESFFKAHGIYSSLGQLYEPVDSNALLYYRETKDGQLLEEGITEAGSMATFTAAGTAYATHGANLIPFYIYYSMFGFQRTGDQIWACADQRAKGFLIGGTAGRTTLQGEGLQHQDGHSHVLACNIPNLKAYDPAFAYEIAIIIQNGLKRMFQNRENIFYYLTVTNENYPMPPMPEGCLEGILKGIYKFRGPTQAFDLTVQLLGSGAILRECLRAQEILESQYQIGANVWSVTSYKELRDDAYDIERWNRLHPEAPPQTAYIQQIFQNESGPIITASDYVRTLPYLISPWMKQPYWALGTDGFGRSDTRESLRRHFEIDAEHIVATSLYLLFKENKL